MNRKINIVFLLLFFNSISMAFGDQPITIYLFPGQAADERLFAKIDLGSNFRLVHIVYPLPQKGATMKAFAKEISKQIDTSGKYIFIGVSIGGMICSELSEYMKPEKIIVISSAKCRAELPLRYRIQKTIPINKIVPEKLIKLGAIILQPLVEPDRNSAKEIFDSMLRSKSPVYYKRTVNMILNWDKKDYDHAIIHIHGTGDHTLPFRNVSAHYTIEGGSHVMTLTRGESINKLLLSILQAQP